MKEVDAIIIGSGQGGVPLAVELAEKGKEIVIIERSSWGGSCVNYGCTPSKTFLASAHAAHEVNHVGRLGIETSRKVHFSEVMDRVRKIIDQWSDGVEERLSQPNLELIQATASFQDSRVVKAGDQQYTAEKIVINTGKSPFIPPISGIENTPYVTYESFWEMEDQPDRLLILGGGYTGVELGQGMARLGTETHILERNNRIIHREEERVSDVITEALEEDGVAFHLETSVNRVSHSSGAYQLETEKGETIHGDALLVATGRKPNTEALQPEASGVDVDDKGHIQVDDKFQTTCPGIYAIGDVTGQPAFTHVSWEDYRRLLSNFNGGDRKQGDRTLAYAFFTSPQVGKVGLSLERAQGKGIKAESETLPLNQVARAIEVGKTRGFYRMVVDQDTDQILGGTLVGPEAAELVHILIAHIRHGATWQDLDQSMHIHPAYAEALPTLARKFKRK